MKTKLISFAFLITLALGASGQDWSKKITYTEPAGSAKSVVEAIGQKAGMNLTTSLAVGKDMILVRFDGVTVSDAMKKIADALDAEWAQEQDGYRLVRSEAKRLQQLRVEGSERTARLKKLLETSGAKAKLNEPVDPAEAQKLAEEQVAAFSGGFGGPGNRRQARQNFAKMADSSLKSPGVKAILKVLGAINIADIGAMAPHSRLVFATAPTQMQKPLSGAVWPIINQFIQEEKTFNEAMNEAMKSNAGGAAAIFGNDAGQPQTGPRNPTKALVIVNRVGQDDNYMIQLVVADQNGEYMAQAFHNLSPQQDDQQSIKPIEGESPIGLSADSTDFIALMKENTMQASTVQDSIAVVSLNNNGDVTTLSNAPTNAPGKLSAKMRERLMNPDKFEPLSTVPNDLLGGVAGQLKKNMIALLPDTILMQSARLCASGPVRPSTVLGNLDSWGLKVVDQGGWLTVTPKQRQEARDEHVDRSALATMLRILGDRGQLSLDEMAAYAISIDDPSITDGFDLFYTRLLDPGSADALFGAGFTNNRDMLRLWGSFGSAQKAQLRGGRSLQFSNMSQQQQKLVFDMVFNGFAGPDVAPGRRGNGPQQRTQRRMAINITPGGGGFAMGMGGSLETERTEALPTGVPPLSTLVLQLQTETAVYGVSSGNGRRDVLSADRLAQTKIKTDDARLQQMFGPPQTYDKFQTATQTNYRFNFAFSNRATMTRTLSDANIDTRTPPVSYEALPAEFRRRVDMAVERMKRMFGNIQLPGGGGQPIPPLP